MSKTVLERVLSEKIIAIVRGISSQQAVNVASALERGGITCIEITFDQSRTEQPEDTLASIRAIRAGFGDRICVGAGTVLSPEQARQAAEAGAQYIISPNVDEAVIRETKRLEALSIPGAMTATEAVFAYNCGADLVKVFPAGLLGPAYIKALKAPLKHVPLIAVGNVTAENAKQWISAGAVGVGVGGELVNSRLAEEARFDEITARARAFKAALQAVPASA